jgi:opacity protein-like surface antigen
MKRFLVSAISLALAGTSLCRSVEAQQRATPFLGGGMASGTGDLSNDTSNGWLVFLGVDFAFLATPGLSIGVVGSYTHIPYRGGFDEAMNIGGIFGEVGYVIAAASPGMFKPYVRGGPGLLVSQYEPGRINARETSETRFGFAAGAGLNIVMQPAAFFLGAHFVTDANAGFLAFHGGVALTRPSTGGTGR